MESRTFIYLLQDPYFPHGVVDLRYAVACEAVGEKDINIRTNQKNVLVSADSITSRDEWVKAIRKVRGCHSFALKTI
jgi:sterol 3beta-glucosyltransferase